MANKKNREPLLYIQQPHLKEPAAPMQDRYFGDYKKTKKREENLPPYMNRKGRGEDLESKKQRAGKKKFADMTILEKLAYLTNRSEYAPAVRCELITESKQKYRGIIREKKQDIILFQPHHRKSPIEIAVKDIHAIHLLGF